MVDILIKKGTIITMNEERDIIKNGAIAIEKGKIIDLGSTEDLANKYSAKKILNASNKAVLPGLFNTHAHFLQNFMKGFKDDLPLTEWINQITLPRISVAVKDFLEGNYDLQYYAALLGCIEALKSGITCVVNMEWATPPKVISAYEDTGIRAIHALTMADQWIMPEALLPHDRTMELADRLISRCKRSRDKRISFRYGLSCPNSCSESLIREVRELANKKGIKIHAHIAETKYERDNIKKLHGKTSVEYLNDIGLLGPDVLAAHCVWLSDHEIEILKETETKVSHNPESNMKLASGVAPISKMLKKGVTVSLASDGCASNDNMDMFEAMRIATLLQKVSNLDATVLSAQNALEMATINGAKALGLGDELGSLELGKKADIILVNLTGVHLRPIHNIVNNLVYCARGSDVDTVIVDGRVVMENRELLLIDDRETVSRAEEFGRSRFAQAGLD